MTTKLTYSGLYGTPSDNVYSILDTRANVPDPRDPANSKIRKFVYNYEPYTQANDWSLYPLIICEDATLEPVTRQTTNHKTELLNWRQVITVRTVRGGSGGTRTDSAGGMTDMRTIVNAILKTFKNETIKQSFRALRMYDMQINVDDVNTGVIEGKSVQETVLSLTYREVMQVTA